jgi:hypothetical protein
MQLLGYAHRLVSGDRKNSESTAMSYHDEVYASQAGAPEPDIEVTPAMLRAGYRAFRKWEPSREEIEVLVASIFFEMMRAADQPRSLITRTNSITLGDSHK